MVLLYVLIIRTCGLKQLVFIVAQINRHQAYSQISKQVKGRWGSLVFARYPEGLGLNPHTATMCEKLFLMSTAVTLLVPFSKQAASHTESLIQDCLPVHLALFQLYDDHIQEVLLPCKVSNMHENSLGFQTITLLNSYLTRYRNGDNGTTLNEIKTNPGNA